MDLELEITIPKNVSRKTTHYCYAYANFACLFEQAIEGMRDFAAIDFETANSERCSICAVGVVVVRAGKVMDKYYSLIKPVPNYYNYWCSRVHGLTAADTNNAPIFPAVWVKIAPAIEHLPLVAHNKAFDESCLKAAFRTYQMDYPNYEFHCTLKQAKRLWRNQPNTLDAVAARCGYTLTQHHNAMADAEACAAIALQIL